ncbi:MAG: hypothetical protein WCK31_03660 [bacterium]
MNELKEKSSPVILTIFGITGDLIKQKVLLSLYSLFLDHKFANGSKIICFIRKDWKDSDLSEYLKKIMIDGKYLESDKFDEFLNLFEVSIGSFDDKVSFTKLLKRISEIETKFEKPIEKINYLAISPEHFQDVISNIGKCGKNIFSNESFNEIKLIVEKPFGLNLSNALVLDQLIAKYFSDEQIYRVDHYLSKYSLRFLEKFSIEKEFGSEFNLKNAVSIKIKILEERGVEGRVSFYEKIGALKDVGQNHLLEMFATLIATQSPKENMGYIENRGETIKSLRVLTNGEIESKVIREQSHKYLELEGVKSNSNIETYFNIQTSSRYFGDKELKVELEGGKYQTQSECSISIYYPKKIISIFLKPQEMICLDDIKVEISSENTKSEYYNIFLDAILENPKYFVSKEEVEEEWKFADPILEYWKDNPIKKNEKSFIWKILILGYGIILLLCLKSNPIVK